MTGRVPSRGSDQFNLRFPEGMRERLKRAAADNGRSMNAEIVARLEHSFHAQPPTLTLGMQTLPSGARPENISVATFVQVFNETMRRVIEDAKQAARAERKSTRADE